MRFLNTALGTVQIELDNIVGKTLKSQLSPLNSLAHKSQSKVSSNLIYLFVLFIFPKQCNNIHIKTYNLL